MLPVEHLSDLHVHAYSSLWKCQSREIRVFRRRRDPCLKNPSAVNRLAFSSIYYSQFTLSSGGTAERKIDRASLPAMHQAYLELHPASENCETASRLG